MGNSVQIQIDLRWSPKTVVCQWHSAGRSIDSDWLVNNFVMILHEKIIFQLTLFFFKKAEYPSREISGCASEIHLFQKWAEDGLF